jgi:hypothetical protein
MTECALLIALLLHRPPGLVSTVYEMAGLSGVCVVEYESQFNDHAFRREELGGTSYGLWQLYDRCHEQYRSDILLHIVAGVFFWSKCMEKGNGSIARAYSIYNSGSPTRSIEKGRAVARRYESWELYLWRRMR